MDKLEKALQKAREERGHAALDHGVHPARRTQSAASLAAPPLPPEPPLSFDLVLEKNRIVAHRMRSPEADLFRLLRTQTLQAMAKTGARTLAITSPAYGNGKTTVAINLAVSIALDINQTVLLVDLDLRKPCVHSYLGLHPESGLTTYLTGKADISDCLVRLPFERMSVLPAGEMIEYSSEILGSPKMRALTDELKTRYADRIVIYDMPPLLEQDDPLTLLPHVDAVLLVVQNGVTTQAEIKRSLDILAGANVIGTVLNGAPEKSAISAV